MFDPYNNAYIVVLRDEDRPKCSPSGSAKSEAGAISMALENVTPPRPMTHDFMKSILDAYDAKVISVVITDLNENTYFAKIHLMYEDSEYTVDARPSDAIALALALQCAGVRQGIRLNKQSSEELEQWLENLEARRFREIGLLMGQTQPCRSPNNRPGRIPVDRVLDEANTDTKILVLARQDGHPDSFPIWVGAAEGHAIKLALDTMLTPRPMSHDLVKSFMEHLNVTSIASSSADVKNSTYYATVYLENKGVERTVDARPSDAISLALRAHCAIVY